MHFFTYLVINNFLEGFEDLKVLNMSMTWMAFPSHRIAMGTIIYIIDLGDLYLDKLYALRLQ